MNIGLFMDSYFPMIDGVSVCVDAIAKEFMHGGHNVTVFVPRVNKKKEWDFLQYPYKIIFCKCGGQVPFLDYYIPYPGATKGFRQNIINAKLDVVHIHSPFAVGRLALKIAKKHSIPAVATLHSKFKSDFYRATKSKFISNIAAKVLVSVFNKADIVTTVNPASIDIAREYGVKSRMEIVPNGTELCKAADTESIAAGIRGEYGIAPEDFILISLGRISKIKNLNFVFEIMKLLKNKTRIKLLLVGGGKDIIYYKKLAKKLDLSGNIIFCGKVYDNGIKAGYFAAADLHVFPSHYDTDGIVKAEAAAVGVPTIFIEGTTAASVVIDNENGYIVPNNPVAFADRIAEIANDREKNKTVGEAAKRTLVKRWDEIAKMYLDIYKQVL
jgi:glycosyltransferase involved in cell wall biosynthesis